MLKSNQQSTSAYDLNDQELREHAAKCAAHAATAGRPDVRFGANETRAFDPHAQTSLASPSAEVGASNRFDSVLLDRDHLALERLTRELNQASGKWVSRDAFDVLRMRVDELEVIQRLLLAHLGFESAHLPERFELRKLKKAA